MPSEAVRPLLARLAADLEGSRGTVLRADGSACISGNDLAGGPWGAALTFGELSRCESSDARWPRLASMLANLRPPTSGRGLFAGADGQAAARVAAREPAQEVASLQPPETELGDLIDGYLGELWARECLGVADDSGQPGWDEDLLPRCAPGLAHGALGGLACLCRGMDPSRLASLLSLHSRQGGAGWCSGAAGTAVAALMAWSATDLSELRDLARRSAEAALAEAPLETDGLCHGTAGVFAVAAGVSRCTGDSRLMLEVRSRAAQAWPDLSQRRWRLDPGRVLDQSWLTGVSGIAWALMAIEQRPLVNPLCPLDSVCASRAGRRRFQAAT
jgi:Lanthionine synthetase C-like protein